MSRRCVSVLPLVAPESTEHLGSSGGEDVLRNSIELSAQLFKLIFCGVQGGLRIGPHGTAELGGEGTVPHVGVGQDPALGVEPTDLLGEPASND